MKLDIVTDKPLLDFYLLDLHGDKIRFDLDKDFDILDGWYEIICESEESVIEIIDVTVNNNSVSHWIYTSYFEYQDGAILQPSTHLHDKGKWRFWIHTNLAYYFQVMYQSITESYLGSNLFERYMLTVDRPVEFEHQYDPLVESFFKLGSGPRWWRKNTVSTPYRVIDNDYFQTQDKELLIQEMRDIFHDKSHLWDAHPKGTEMLSLREDGRTVLPVIDIQDIPSAMIQEVVRQAGFKNVLNIFLSIIPAESTIGIHIDDQYYRPGIRLLSGATQFNWPLTPQATTYFRLGEAGLIPNDKPAFINPQRHTHSLVNDSSQARAVMYIYGELEIPRV